MIFGQTGRGLRLGTDEVQHLPAFFNKTPAYLVLTHYLGNCIIKLRLRFSVELLLL